jgi:carbamate kinase
MRILVSLGGNALAREGQRGTWDEQRANARAIAASLVQLSSSGHSIIIAHGNGPQVGSLAVQQITGSGEVPPLPLDALVAMTQGELGYLIQQSIGEVAPMLPTAVIITRVRVDAADVAFSQPVKPIGPYYEEHEARRRAERYGWVVGPDAGRGWRRLVASPAPVDVLEAAQIRMLSESGVMVIAAGGGGVPVVRSGAAVHGVEAVIDKDRTSLVLARDTECDTLLLATGVSQVALGFGTRWQQNIGCLTVRQARRHLADGEFPAGSMGPKIEAAAAFAAAGGRAVITSPDRLVEALDGRDGTWIVPDAQGPSRRSFRVPALDA